MKCFSILLGWIAVLSIACGGQSSSSLSDAGEQSDGTGDVDSDVDSDSDADTDTGDPGWVPDTDGTVEVLDGGVVITEEDGTTVVCYNTTCDGRLLECGDCVDNDSDGKVDWRDQECLGPCDNTEGPALISDVGGVTGSTCHVDCYFDYGNGMGTGSDDCWWDHQCDPLEPEAQLCPYSEKVANNEKFCPSDQSSLCDRNMSAVHSKWMRLFWMLHLPRAGGTRGRGNGWVRLDWRQGCEQQRNLHVRRYSRPEEMSPLHPHPQLHERMRALRDMYRKTRTTRRVF